jgi:hypothetical protein
MNSASSGQGKVGVVMNIGGGGGAVPVTLMSFKELVKTCQILPTTPCFFSFFSSLLSPSHV